jgi:hypothetical protein
VTCCWLSVRAAWRLLHAACMHLTLDTLKTVLLDAVYVNGGTSGGCQLSPRCLLVSNLGGMGPGHLWGPFASFMLVRGDDGDLPGTSASVLRLTSPVLLGSLAGKVRRTAVLTPSTAHFELRRLDHLGTNGSILETDTPRQAAGWRFLL